MSEAAGEPGGKQLGGRAFVAFYAVAAIPVGRYADRSNRRNLLAGAIAVWSTATAIAFILVGTGAGVMAGAFLAGLINDHYGWRAAFVLLGAPGLLLAALVWLTFPEPVRGA